MLHVLSYVLAVSRSATAAFIRSTRRCRCWGRRCSCRYPGTPRDTTSHSCTRAPHTSSWSGPAPARDTDPPPHSTSPPTYQVCCCVCQIPSHLLIGPFVQAVKSDSGISVVIRRINSITIQRICWYGKRWQKTMDLWHTFILLEIKWFYLQIH